MACKPKAVTVLFLVLGILGATFGRLGAADLAKPKRKGPSEATQPTAEKPEPVAKEALRYDGKSFTQWRSYLRTELKPARRVEAIKALVAFGVNGYGPEAAAVIVQFVKERHREFGDQDEKEICVEQETQEALATIGESAVAVLAEALKDQDKDIRGYAATVLRYRFDAVPASAVPALVRAARDEEMEVRYLAVKALVGKEGAHPALKKILQDEAEAKKFVASLIGVLRAKGSEQDLDVQWGRESAYVLLGTIGPRAQAAVPVLVHELKTSKSESDRTNAADTLGKIGADVQGVVPTLIEALKDKDVSVRASAAESLGLFGPRAKAALPALREALRAHVPRPEDPGALPPPSVIADVPDEPALGMAAAAAIKKISRE
jgi:hypothetical protein